MHHFRTGALLVFSSAVCCGLIPIFAIYAYQGSATVFEVIFLRAVIASGIFFLYLLLRPRKISLNRVLVGYLLITGIVEGLQASLFLTAVKYIQASLAELLFYTYPVLVSVFSFFLFKERLSVKATAAAAFSFVGLLMVLGTSMGKVNLYGVLLALGAALVCAFDVLLSYRVVKEVEPVVASAFITMFTALASLPVGLLSGQITFSIEFKGWLAITACALICTNLARVAFLTGIKRVGSTFASVLCLVEPLVTVAFSALLFSQVLSAVQLLGGMVILAGGAMVVAARKAPSGEVQADRASYRPHS
jgi:drug/metabolite transporter (DMT)-like permease